MTATTTRLAQIPVKQIKPDPNQPRKTFDQEAHDALTESVRQLGILTPITVRKNGTGYVIVAGERRFRAAVDAKLKDVPCLIRADESTQAAQIAENVARADLSPVEEAAAYKQLLDDGSPVEQIGRLVGRSAALVEARLQLLDLPSEVQEKIGRSVTLACAPTLVQVAKLDPLLARCAAAYLAGRPEAQVTFPDDPGDVLDAALHNEWRDAPDDTPDPDADPKGYAKALKKAPVLIPPTLAGRGWSGLGGFIYPHRKGSELDAVLYRLQGHGKKVEQAYSTLDPIVVPEAYGNARYEAERLLRERDSACLGWNGDDLDAARAYGCLIEAGDDWKGVSDPEWAADRLVQKIEAQAAVEAKEKEKPQKKAAAGGDSSDKAQRKAQRDRQKQEAQDARDHNVKVGVAAKKWAASSAADQLAVVKAMALDLLDDHGFGLAWSTVLADEAHPVKRFKDGSFNKVEYPRGNARDEAAGQLMAKVKAAKTVEDVLTIIGRGLICAAFLDTAGMPGTDRQGHHVSMATTYAAQTRGLIERFGMKALPTAMRAELKAKAAAEAAAYDDDDYEDEDDLG